MEEQPTCGKGLAANAEVPAGLAQLMVAMADVLDVHTRALDPGDERAFRELQAYRAVIVEQRKAASQLDAVADLMRSERELPMAPHDPEAMRSPAAAQALDRYRAAAAAIRRVLDKLDPGG
jgi:hypothetical protein